MENAAMLEEGNKNTDILFFLSWEGKQAGSAVSKMLKSEGKKWRNRWMWVTVTVVIDRWPILGYSCFLHHHHPHPPTTLFRNKWRLTEKRWMVFKRISLLLASSSLWSSMCSCFFLISFHFFYHHLILQISARRDVVRGKMEIFIWTQAK